MLKEKYLQIQNWLETANKKTIDFIKKERISHNYLGETDYDKFIFTIEWYDNLLKESEFIRQVIFGEIILSIDDIKIQVLSELKKDYQAKIDHKDFMDEDDEYYDDENSGYYDVNGHYNKEGHEAVISFFESLDDYKIQSICSGSVEDDYEVDITGGRSYLMRGIPLNQMLFNYLNYTKKLSLDELDEELCNSNESFDEIANYYEDIDIFLPNEQELNSIHNFVIDNKYQQLINRYNHLVDNIIINFSNEPLLKEKMVIANSMKIDSDYIKSKLREEKINKILI
jgi:hypothetical protein